MTKINENFILKTSMKNKGLLRKERKKEEKKERERRTDLKIIRIQTRTYLNTFNLFKYCSGTTVSKTVSA